MSDSSSVLSTLLLTTLQAAKEAAANVLFNSASPAMLYAQNPATTSGLTWGYIGGRLSSTAIANGTVALTASTTNYVVANRSTGAVTAATTTTNWNDANNYLRLYLVVTGVSTITSYEDHRTGISGIGAAFAGGTLSLPLNEAPTVTLASASTLNIGAASANTIAVTGTTSITAFDTIAAGALRRLVFGASLTLTHNATSLILPGARNIVTAADDTALFLSLGSGNWRCVQYQRAGGLAPFETKVIQLAASDETTALSVGTAKVTFRMPYAMTLTAVRASLSTAQTSGSILTINVKEGGTTIFSTKPTFDNTEKSTTTAATASVLSDTSLADDAEITVDIDQVGDGTAKGLKVTLIGY